MLNYAKVNSQDFFVRDEMSTVRIVCGDELKDLYYDNENVFPYFMTVVVLPIALLVLVGLFARLHRKKLEEKCIKPSNHANLAGCVLTGVCVMLYVIGMDMAAIILLFTNRHEYREYDINYTFNLIVIVITTTFDMLAMLYSITAWSTFVSWTCSYKYFQCKPEAKHTTCFRNCLKCLFVPYFYFVFGYKKHDILWKEESQGGEYGENQSDIKEKVFVTRQAWALLSLMIGPLFCFTSHISYILIAWLTEPHKTSSILVLSLVILIYLFTLFRSLYKSSEGHATSDSFSCNIACKGVVTFLRSFCHCCIICYANYNGDHIKDLESVDFSVEYSKNTQHDDRQCDTTSTNEMKVFSKTRLTSSFVLGIFGILPLGLTLVAFNSIPIPALELANYLRNIIEIILVLFAALATHRIFALKESDTTRLIRKFKDSYQEKRDSKKKLSGNLFEAFGEIAGEVCQSMHKNCECSTAQPLNHSLSNKASILNINEARQPDNVFESYH